MLCIGCKCSSQNLVTVFKDSDKPASQEAADILFSS